MIADQLEAVTSAAMAGSSNDGKPVKAHPDIVSDESAIGSHIDADPIVERDGIDGPLVTDEQMQKPDHHVFFSSFRIRYTVASLIPICSPMALRVTPSAASLRTS